jgi:uncharacterized protein (TIGR02147 family)
MITQGYRELLKQHLAARMENNPRYSLRAFSRDLEISASRLSEILNGKQGLSGDRAVKIAGRLGLSNTEAADFRRLVLASDGRAKRTREEAQAALEQPTTYFTLEDDVFHTISDWYHYAILELTKTKGFKNVPAWIGRRLGITEYEAKLAVERLQRLGLLEIRRGALRVAKSNITTPNGIPSEAVRKFNRQLLAKAAESIATQTVEERDISTLTVAVRKRDIDLVKDKIKKFRRELNALLEASVPNTEGDEVYTLAVQFFRLTNKEQL